MSEKKIRIYELAKEYNVSSKELMEVLSKNQIEFKNHTSTVGEETVHLLDSKFRSGKKKPEQKTAEEPLKSGGASAKPVQSVPPQEEKKREEQPSAAPLQKNAGQPRTGHSSGPTRPVARDTQAERSDTRVPRSDTTQTPSRNAAPRPQQDRPASSHPRPAYSHGRSPVGAKPSDSAPRGAEPRRQERPSSEGNRPFHGSRNPNPSAQGARPATPGMRPATPGTRPATPGTRPVAPGTRPAAPGTRPATPKPGVVAATPNKTETSNRFGGKKKEKEKDGNRWREGELNKKNKNVKKTKHPFQKPVESKAEKLRPEKIEVGESISVKDFAEKAGLETNEVIKKLLLLGIMATINQEIDFDTAALIGSDFEIVVEELPPEADPTEIEEEDDDPASLVARPPVVTIMGHVDHGKTSLLDTIRATNVTAREAGGITQHIGAYQISVKGKKITFLDTPGHEAFTAMRARGAEATDIAILVVAANDGVMPQTIEAINHAKFAKVPIIVAINKMDIPEANPDRVKQQLSEQGLISEEWGGDTIMVPVSARQKLGIDDLLENVLLVAEVAELKANPNRKAQGIVIEAQLDKGRGPVATILVQKGTLRVGDSLVAGTASGKVRALINDKGDPVKKAEPSVPVEVLGLSDVPEAGDLAVVADEKVIRSVVAKRLVKKKSEEQQQNQKVSLEDIFQQIQDGQIKDLNIVIKGDVQGSIEALRQSLENLRNKEVRVNIVHSGVGAINETDIMLASAANAIVIGFNVRPDANARKSAEAEKVDVRTYRVIYEAISDIEQALEGMLAPEFKEVVYGHAEVRQVISIPKGGVVAGSYVQDGKITNRSMIRVTRGGIVIHEGEIDSLRRFKDDVKEVAAGYECGISIERFRDVKEGDILEAYGMEEVKRG